LKISIYDKTNWTYRIFQPDSLYKKFLNVNKKCMHASN
jgi:hypothetical protein